jgi:hypothetical protein
LINLQGRLSFSAVELLAIAPRCCWSWKSGNVSGSAGAAQDRTVRRAAQLPPGKSFESIEPNTLLPPLLRKLLELAAGAFLERAENA